MRYVCAQYIEIPDTSIWHAGVYISLLITMFVACSIHSCHARTLKIFQVEFIFENITISIISQHHDGTSSLEVSLSWKQKLHIMHGQYHSCWWLVDARSQVISTHGTDLDLLEYSSFSTSGVKGFWEWHLHLASNWSKLYLWEIKSLAWKEAEFPPRLSHHTGYISRLIEVNMLNGNGHGIFGIHFTNSLRAHNFNIIKYMLVICDTWWLGNSKIM